MRPVAIAALALIALAFAGPAFAQKVQIQSVLEGPEKCLDIVNDGANTELRMADCGNYTGRSWSRIATDVAGHVRLKTDFTGAGRCLDVVNDGVNNRVRMVRCEDVSGQYWQLRNGAWTNTFTGPDKCLRVANDGTERVLLDACDRSRSQQWTTRRAP